MQKKKHLLMFVSMILVILLAITGCGGSNNTSEESGKKDKLIFAADRDATSADPHATNDTQSLLVISQIYDTLLRQNPDTMEPEPCLAETWDNVNDTTIEFKLKQGVKFQNGEEMKASDVKFTFERALKSSHIKHIVGEIDPEKIEVIDDYTIRIGTYKPFSPMIACLAHPSTSILNEKAVNEAGENYGQDPVGTGPYKLVKWNKGDSIEFTRFDDYHGEKAKIKDLVYRVLPEPENRVIELETGGADIVVDVPATATSRIEKDPNLMLVKKAELSSNYLGFNLQKKPFDDVRVRKAICHAIDVNEIVETVYEGNAVPAAGPISPGTLGYNEDLKLHELNIEKAKQLLAEAGYPNGFKATLWTNDKKERLDIAEIVQNRLREINIEVSVQVLEWGVYLERTANGEHDMYLLGWVNNMGDPDGALYGLFSSSKLGTGGNRNFYVSTEVDELLEQGREEFDTEKRKQIYNRCQEIIYNDAPCLYINYGEYIYATRKNVKGFRLHPAMSHRLWEVYFEED